MKGWMDARMACKGGLLGGGGPSQRKTGFEERGRAPGLQHTQHTRSAAQKRSGVVAITFFLFLYRGWQHRI